MTLLCFGSVFRGTLSHPFKQAHRNSTNKHHNKNNKLNIVIVAITMGARVTIREI